MGEANWAGRKRSLGTDRSKPHRGRVEYFHVADISTILHNHRQNMKNLRPTGPRSTIYRLTMGAFILVLIILGLLCANLANSLASSGDSWKTAVTLLNALSDVLIVSGAIGIALELFTGRAKDEADTERIRALLKESAPDFRDAVVEGFAVQPDDLARVASPELLDGIAKNVLALRLGDEHFASEIYEQVRDQAIRASERWQDVDVSVRLSSMDERSAVGAPLYDLLIEWEYTTIPSHAVRKFTCVSDSDEFYDLITDVPATSAWFMPKHTGVDAAARTSYELLSFAVDGEELPVRRSTRKAGQTYAVHLAEAIIDTKPVRIRTVYRAVGSRTAHRFFLEIPVPARDLSLTIDYTNTDIARLSVTDAVNSLAKPQVSQIPEHLPGRELKIDIPGWVLPRSGFTAVWVLQSEEPTSAAPGASVAA